MISYFIVKTIIFNTIVIIDRIAHAMAFLFLALSQQSMKSCAMLSNGGWLHMTIRKRDCCKRLFAHFTVYNFLVSLQLKRLGGNFPWNLKLRA